MSTSPKQRVLQYITRLGLGGAESVALSIVRGLHREFDFGVFAVRGMEPSDIGRAMRDELATLNVPVFSGPKLPLKAGGLAVAGFRARQVTRRFRPNAIHLHTEIPEAAYAVMMALGGAPVLPQPALVRTIHNWLYWHFWPRLGRWCESKMVESCVVGVSQDALSGFVSHRTASGLGPPAISPVVVYNGVEIPPRASTVPQSRARARLLFAGRFEHQKGGDLLPEILARTKTPPSGAELVCHGQGSDEAILRRLAAHPPPGWSVRLLPPLLNLGAHMQEFDGLIMPSRFEGVGLVAVEAVLAGVPVVATEARGLREVFPPGYPGQGKVDDPVDLAARLQHLLLDRQSWAPHVARAAEFARARFDLDAMLQGYRRVYYDCSATR